MTKPMIKVPSMEIRELRWTIAEKDATLLSASHGKNTLFSDQ